MSTRYAQNPVIDQPNSPSLGAALGCFEANGLVGKALLAVIVVLFMGSGEAAEPRSVRILLSSLDIVRVSSSQLFSAELELWIS